LTEDVRPGIVFQKGAKLTTKKLFLALFLTGCLPAAAGPPAKSLVRYREDAEIFSRHLQVQILTGQVAIYAVEKEKKYSEKKTAYYVYFPDNREKEPPYYSSLFLVGPAGTKAIKLHLKDHGRCEPFFLWLNEKWFFGRVWITDDTALEFILDLESGELVKKTVADFSAWSEKDGK